MTLVKKPSGVFERETDDPVEERGLRYRVPGQAELIVEQIFHDQDCGGNNNGHSIKLLRKSLVMPQFGRVLYLPAKPGGTKTKQVMALYAATGAIKSYEVSANSAVASAIDGLGSVSDAAFGFMDAKDNEAATLTDEVALLKLQKEKLELEAALELLRSGGATEEDGGS